MIFCICYVHNNLIDYPPETTCEIRQPNNIKKIIRIFITITNFFFSILNIKIIIESCLYKWY